MRLDRMIAVGVILLGLGSGLTAKEQYERDVNIITTNYDLVDTTYIDRGRIDGVKVGDKYKVNFRDGKLATQVVVTGVFDRMASVKIVDSWLLKDGQKANFNQRSMLAGVDSKERRPAPDIKIGKKAAETAPGIAAVPAAPAAPGAPDLGAPPAAPGAPDLGAPPAAPGAPDPGLPPAPPTGLPPAPDTGLPPAPDTGLPPAPDTGLPPAPDTGLPPAPDAGGAPPAPPGGAPPPPPDLGGAPPPPDAGGAPPPPPDAGGAPPPPDPGGAPPPPPPPAF